MALDHAQRLAQRQATTLNANLIMTSAMLRYSAVEFEQAVAREINENPAFAVEERIHCVRCGSSLRLGACPNCDVSSRASPINGERPPSFEDDEWEPS